MGTAPNKSVLLSLANASMLATEISCHDRSITGVRVRVRVCQ